jgi:alpha-L-fucosidase 2
MGSLQAHPQTMRREPALGMLTSPLRRERFTLVCTVAWCCLGMIASSQTVQSRSIYSGPPPEKPISILQFVPPDQRVVAMPLKERIQLGAVPKRGMCSTAPAKTPDNGLLSGNGKMWVEVFGDPFSEQIVFHQENLLQPWRDHPLQAPQIASVLPEVRKLILAGEYRQALELSLSAAEKTDTKPGTDNLRDHPAFNMRVIESDPHSVSDYLRTTDFESGEVKVTWRDNQGVWVRRTFVSRPDNAVVQLLTAPAQGAINGTLQLDTSMVLPGRRTNGAGTRITERAAQSGTLHEPGADRVRFLRAFDPHHLVLQGYYSAAQGHPGYASVTRVIAVGGTVISDKDELNLNGVRSLTLITRVETWPDMEQKNVDSLEKAVDEITPDYETLLQRHAPGQASVIDRASVDFGASSLHAMSGEEMLIDQRTRQGYNPALLEDMFDMGRYWLYLRSGDYPPMWGHININVNLQISSAVMGNLPEAITSYTHWLEGLLPDAKVNAANIFGAQGALFGIHPTVEGDPLTHFDFTWPHQYWISGGGWMYSPLWDYYLATADRQFLQEHILPGLKELALFYESYLTIEDKTGHYIFVPSYSPENWPKNTQDSPVVINAAMDIAVCREVFTHLIAASEILGVESENIAHWKAILAQLPPYLLDSDGALKEWEWPGIQEALDHRHVSHLYGVWPADEITPDETPELARAAWLAARKRGQGNASAHGLLHRSLAAARLKDPYLVNFDLKQLLEQGYVNPSLTTMHNPYALPSPDPQGGIPTLIMEMLVYSRPGVIGLLPAMPDSLTKGSIKGILARTQATVDQLTWNLETGRIDLTLTSRIDQTLQLFVRRGIERIDTTDGVLVVPVAAGAEECTIHLQALRPTTLHFSIGRAEPSAWIGRGGQ